MKNTKLLAITMVSNVLGIINPVKEIIFRVRQNAESRSKESSSRLRSNNKWPIVLVDAAQAVSHMRVDVQDLDADFLVFSGHKLFAGTGVGILYGKKHLLEEMPPFLFGGEMIREVRIEKSTFANIPHKFEAGTLPIADIVSLGAAIDYVESLGMENIMKHEKQLMAYGLSQIGKIEGIKIFGPTDLEKRAGVISFTIEGIHPHDIAQILGEMGICIRVGHHCAMPLHKRLGVPATARVSFSIYNDKSDIDALINGLKKVVDMINK